MTIRLAIVLLLALLLCLFAVQNTQVVELRFLVWSLEMSRVFLILGAFLGGVLVGVLTRGVVRWR